MRLLINGSHTCTKVLHATDRASGEVIDDHPDHYPCPCGQGGSNLVCPLWATRSEAQGRQPNERSEAGATVVIAASVSDREPVGALVWMLLDCLSGRSGGGPVGVCTRLLCCRPSASLRVGLVGFTPVGADVQTATTNTRTCRPRQRIHERAPMARWVRG